MFKYLFQLPIQIQDGVFRKFFHLLKTNKLIIVSIPWSAKLILLISGRLISDHNKKKYMTLLDINYHHALP